jgi:twitching motility protein PilT
MAAPAIHALFEDLMKRGGSDLHLATNRPPLARVRGDIVALREENVSGKDLEEMLLEIVTPAQKSRLAADLDLDLSIVYGDAARFRGTYYVKHTGIAATFRLVPLHVPSLAELGCPEILWRLADRRGGLILVAGPASSGKTTTAAAMIDHVNKTRACHIVTIEDPIEFVHEPLRAQISQREIGTHAPSFSAALRTAARENADVVYISDVTRPDEMALALDLANDGLLVFATIPCSGAAAALWRVLATFAADAQARARSQLADGLAAVVVQHLVRAADFKSRIAVHEILVRTPEIAQLIRAGDLHAINAAIAEGNTHGMQSLDRGLERLVAARKISAESAFERAIDKEAFARLLQQRGEAEAPRS